MNTLSIILQVPTTQAAHHAADEFVKLDPTGFGMAIIAMAVVFSVLAVIYFIYKNLAKIISYQTRPKNVTVATTAGQAPIKENQVSTEVGAAISMALHLFNESQHDLESLTLTIQKVSKMYSPWSSKIYTLRQLPR